jgi:AcrR family transcriptional regulator
MTAHTPASYHHGDLRRALIETGLRLISEGGVQSLSLREASRLAGVSEAAPYRHFSGKEALLAAIAAEGFTKLHDCIAAGARARLKDPAGMLHEMAWRYVQFASQETAHFRVMFGSTLLPAQVAKYPGLVRAIEEARNALIGVVIYAQANGYLSRTTGAEIMATHLWCAVHGITVLFAEDHLHKRSGFLPGRTREAIHAYIEALLPGFQR